MQTLSLRIRRKRPNHKGSFSRDYIRNGDTMNEVSIPHRICLAHGNSKGEARGRNRH